MLDVGDGHSIYWERAGTKRRQAGRLPAWRAGRRHLAEAPAAVRPGALRRDPVRPARLRQVDAACRARGQHDLAPRRRHRAAARKIRLRQMAGVRRLLGLDAGAGLCRDASRRVSELVVRGIYTLTKAELDWYYQFGVSEMFPDKWERFLAPIPEAERGDMMAAYRKRLVDPDRAVQLAAAAPGACGKARRSRCCPTPRPAAPSARTTSPSPSPASRTTISSMPAGWRRGS